MANMDKKIGFWSFVWREMRGISIKEILSFVMIIVGVCIICYAIEPHVDNFLIEWLNKWVEPLDELSIVVAMYTIVFIGIVAYLYDHIRNVLLTKVWWMVWILVTIIYTYYRNQEPPTFLFWKYGIWRWLDIIYVIDGLIVLSALLYVVLAWNRVREALETKSELLRDDAIQNANEDQLEYNDIAEELKKRLDAIDISRRAFSVGITGEWGIGKSSLLNLLAAKLKSEGLIVIRFAPRSAKKAELIQEEFFSVFTHELERYSFSAPKTIGKYAYALNLHSSTRWMYSILDWFETWTAESERQTINDIIRSTGKRIFVVIEDLDRLTGKEILEVLKLIDANGNFCNTVFITAYDTEYVNRVLQKELGYTNPKSAFTDKYFQYERPLFKQQKADLYKFLNQYMFIWAIRACGENTHLQRQIEKEWAHVPGILLNYLKTLRHIKRYVNLFRTTYGKIMTNVDFADFAIVTLIRYFDIDAYNALYNKNYLAYEGTWFSDRKAYKLADKYKELSKSDIIANMPALLEFLFPTEGSYRQFDSQYNRIYRVESFDNYFYDKIEGKLYYGDINLMMNDVNIKDAINRFDSYVDVPNPLRSKQSIIEYLTYREAPWIQSKTRLVRYVSLVLYATYKISDIYITTTLNRILITQTAEEYAPYMNKQEYLECVLKAFEDMQYFVPYSICVYMKLRLKERYADVQKENESIFLESIEDDQKIISDSQVKYDALYGMSGWQAVQSLNVAAPIENEEEKDYSVRLQQLKEMLLAHPDDYAKGMIAAVSERHGPDTAYLIIRLLHEEIVEKALSKSGFAKWLKSIVDKDVRCIIECLLAEKEEHGYASARINQQVDNPEQNYALIAMLLKESNESKT